MLGIQKGNGYAPRLVSIHHHGSASHGGLRAVHQPRLADHGARRTRRGRGHRCGPRRHRVHHGHRTDDHRHPRGAHRQRSAVVQLRTDQLLRRLPRPPGERGQLRTLRQHLRLGPGVQPGRLHHHLPAEHHRVQRGLRGFAERSAQLRRLRSCLPGSHQRERRLRLGPVRRRLQLRVHQLLRCLSQPSGRRVQLRRVWQHLRLGLELRERGLLDELRPRLRAVR